MTALLVLALQLQAASPSAPRARAGDDPWFGADKLKHALLAGYAQAVGYAALRALSVRHGHAQSGAFVATMTLAVGKEAVDRRSYGRFSVRDLVWGAAGAGAAAAILSRTAR